MPKPKRSIKTIRKVVDSSLFFDLSMSDIVSFGEISCQDEKIRL